MRFKEAVRTCMKKKYATFRGRASRSEFWHFMIFLWSGVLFWAIAGGIAAFILNKIMAKTANIAASENPYAIYCLIPLLIFILATVIPSISVAWRRFHDLNLPGWLYLLFAPAGAVPTVGTIVSIIFFVLTSLKGTDGKNKYGDDPSESARKKHPSHSDKAHHAMRG